MRGARFGKFGLVGLAGVGVQLGVLAVLMRGLGWSAAVATAAAVESAVLHNFLWHERFTWRERRRAGLPALAGRLWRFQASNGLVSLLGNTALSYWLVERCAAPAGVVAVGSIGVCSVVNFWIADKWVYGGVRR